MTSAIVVLLRLANPVLGLALSLSSLAGEFRLVPANSLPDNEVSEAVRSVVESKGVRVNGPDGKSVGEFWGRSTPFDGKPAMEFGVRFEIVPEGAFLGVARFSGRGADFRQQSVPVGLYTMRYGLHPEDGNHMGVAASRDFALLIPIDEDPDPSKNLSFDELVTMTLRVGNPHPTILRVELPEGEGSPYLWENDHGYWVLDLQVGGELIGFVVDGRADE